MFSFIYFFCHRPVISLWQKKSNNNSKFSLGWNWWFGILLYMLGREGIQNIFPFVVQITEKQKYIFFLQNLYNLISDWVGKTMFNVFRSIGIWRGIYMCEYMRAFVRCVKLSNFNLFFCLQNRIDLLLFIFWRFSFHDLL